MTSYSNIPSYNQDDEFDLAKDDGADSDDESWTSPQAQVNDQQDLSSHNHSLHHVNNPLRCLLKDVTLRRPPSNETPSETSSESCSSSESSSESSDDMSEDDSPYDPTDNVLESNAKVSRVDAKEVQDVTLRKRIVFICSSLCLYLIQKSIQPNHS